MEFIEGGADDEVTARANTRAFEKYALVPHVLVDVDKVVTSTMVLGRRIELPVFISPTGGSCLFHHEGEKAVARAASSAGTFYSLSTFGTTRLEDLAQAATGPKLFQLYPMRDKDLNIEIIRRCRAAGYDALCVTVDCAVQGNRERDFRSGLATRPRRLNAWSLLSVASHPGWLWHYLRAPHMLTASFARSTHMDRSERKAVQALAAQLDASVNWQQVAALVRQWQGPFAIKGVLSADDARRAADIGATAVIVSNHGGRQLDGAIASIDALPRIVAAVGDRIEVILDGGVRRGTHVLKALALGAKACTIGRPYLYGLAAAGEAGVGRALEILSSEIKRGLALLGCADVQTLDGRYIQWM